MGVFLLGETMSLQGWVGCIVIISALALLGIVESRTKPVPETDLL